jgi:Trk-type K+ transport system membrane component
MVDGSRMSQRTIRVLSSVNGSSTAVSVSGISTMSDSLMPFQPAMEEPSNILPSSSTSLEW